MPTTAWAGPGGGQDPRTQFGHLHVGGGDPNVQALACCLSGCTSTGGERDRSPGPLIRDVGIPGGILSPAPNACPLCLGNPIRSFPSHRSVVSTKRIASQERGAGGPCPQGPSDRAVRVQGRRLRQQGWRFLTHKRNALDTSVVLVSFVILVLDLRQIFLHRTYMAQRRQDRDRFINFHEAVQVDSAVTHLVGILVLLATVQLWNLLHHDARLQVISRTLSRAWDEVTGFLLIILLLLTGYATVFHVLFGWKISDYRTFVNSVVTVVGLLMGISHYKEVIALDPVLGCFLILASAILMVLVVINLFVSAILMAFGKERKSLKTETTLLDMLLQKLSSLLGIRWHQNPSPEKQP